MQHIHRLKVWLLAALMVLSVAAVLVLGRPGTSWAGPNGPGGETVPTDYLLYVPFVMRSAD